MGRPKVQLSICLMATGDCMTAECVFDQLHTAAKSCSNAQLRCRIVKLLMQALLQSHVYTKSRSDNMSDNACVSTVSSVCRYVCWWLVGQTLMTGVMSPPSGIVTATATFMCSLYVIPLPSAVHAAAHTAILSVHIAISSTVSTKGLYQTCHDTLHL